MNKNILGKLLVSVTVAGLLRVDGVAIGQVEPEDQLRDRIGYVEKLLNDSTAAEQVKDSDVEAAKSLRAEAIEKYAVALQANESGDYETAKADLSEAVRLMYTAVNATQSSGVATDKSDRDFENRRASVDALLAAHQRISEEKNQQKEHDLLQQDVATELRMADEFLKSGESEQARRHLDEAYDLVRSAVKQLREGDTLVRELKFATKEDEYIYELDRNDSHKMLISVLLEDKLEDERIRNRVTPLISTAEELRAAAESQATEGHFAEAVETLEQSTQKLVKAIREAGVYIPG